MKINEALKDLRTELGLTQKEMIEKTNITVTHYSKMEKGQNRIFVEDLIEILDRRHISINYFFGKYFKDNEKNLNISEKLNEAFYEKNLVKVKRIKEQIFADRTSSNELKDRAILIINILSPNEAPLAIDKAMKDFFKYKNWTQNDNAITILSNSIRQNNLSSIKSLVLKLIKSYPNLSECTVSKQRKLITVGINYLYNSRKSHINLNNDVTIQILNWLKSMSNIPELGILKELYMYFLALYTGHNKIAENIKEVLKITGFENISEQLPN
ncbi:helix-turn-helix transcriptional regulator [Lactobacillus sp. LL6]|uniref:helix-turn-helix domain-containing protein n=1 Tax=Lactobacillus sp. LL6 TaxID=2596827 RepID=UPI001186DC5C|nr:helix-turn-helix transcriptional regulator [Lactobacillus sp. LL6]TSO25532.1 helix-turn-helix transcriptional regulator [Lactobacillus sp. LL6]